MLTLIFTGNNPRNIHTLVCGGEKIKYSKVLALLLMQEVESFCRPMCLSRFKKMEFVALA